MNTSIFKFIQFSTKVVFINKFMYFLLIALAAYILMVNTLIFSDNEVTLSMMYFVLMLPAILFIFYPTCFSIQNDEDSKIVELIFGIANYRYKTWLMRLFIAYVICFIMIYLLTEFSNWGIIDIPVLEMTIHVMISTFFAGMLCFMLSCIIRNGFGSAVVFFVIIIILLILSSVLGESQWNVFLNPYTTPRGNIEIFNNTVFNNRIIMMISAIIMLMIGLSRLQNREKFI